MMGPQRRFGIILPGSREDHGGNWWDFARIRKQFRLRGVHWFERELHNEYSQATATCFWFYESELPKLPTDFDSERNNGGWPYYVPVEEDSGHGVCRMDGLLEIHSGKDVQKSK
jgi:hypothetical protein